jgi:hypothetical protein
MKPKQSDYFVFHYVLISGGRLDKNRLHFTTDRGIYSLKLYTIISLAEEIVTVCRIPIQTGSQYGLSAIELYIINNRKHMDKNWILIMLH